MNKFRGFPFDFTIRRAVRGLTESLKKGWAICRNSQQKQKITKKLTSGYVGLRVLSQGPEIARN